MGFQAKREVSEVDLTGCDKEPVQIPGFIQSHGFIIGFSEEGVVTRISENLLQKAGVKANEVVSRLVTDVPLAMREFCQQCFAVKNRGQSSVINFGSMRLVARQVSADKHLLIDLEPAKGEGVTGLGFRELVKDDVELHRAELFQDAVHRLSGLSDTRAVCDNLVIILQTLSNYDRVMVYQFDYDKSGIVVSEAKKEGLEPFLGLRYPAFDIPQQVRELFKLNTCRVICDIESSSSPILSLANLRPLDLSYSMLRGVSPVHIQYLANMGVRASASFSIIIDGELWGLVACHQYNQAKYVSPAFRAKCDMLISMATLAIASIENLIEFRKNEVRQGINTKFFSFLKSGATVESVFSHYWADICNINESYGMALIQGTDVLNWGNTPGAEFIRRLGFWLDHTMNSHESFSTNSLPVQWEAAEAEKETACGILVLRVPVIKEGLSTRGFMVWFRPELISTVNWAGNPEKTIVPDEKGARLSPRTSFEKWVQQVYLQSERWSQHQVAATERFRDEYVRYCIQQQEEVIRENLRLTSIQQGKLELAARILHDIGNILSGIQTKISCNTAKPPWVEVTKLGELRDLVLQNLDAFESVLGGGRGAILQNFSELLAQSLRDRESEVREDFGILASLVGEVEKILEVQRDFAQSGAVRATHELVLEDVVLQALRLTVKKEEEKTMQCSVRIGRGILVRADESKLLRVLMHCIRQCIDSIHAASLGSGGIEIRAMIKPGTEGMSRYSVFLRFTDGGAGLPQEIQRELAMAGHDEASRVSSLTYQILLCREAMRSLGGTFTVESASDGRACIQTIVMPCALEMDVLEELHNGATRII